MQKTEPLQPSYVETSFREHEPVGGYRVASARQGTLTIRVRPPRSAVPLLIAAVWNAFVCIFHYFVGLSSIPALLFLLIFDLAGAWLTYVGVAAWVRTTMTIELSPSSLSSRQRPIPMQRAVAVDASSIRDIELAKHTLDDDGSALTHRLVAVTDRGRVTIAGLLEPDAARFVLHTLREHLGLDGLDASVGTPAPDELNAVQLS